MKRYILFLLSAVLLQAQAQKQNHVRFAFLTDIHLSPDAESEANLIRTVDEINGGEFDFTIISGDLTNMGSDAELNACKSAFARLKRPYHVITGNHETTWSESAGQTFKRLWGDDKIAFEHGDFLFIGFGSGPYMKMGSGHVNEDDIYWLEKELNKRNLENKTVVFVCHYPLIEDLDNWFVITEILNRHKVRLALCGHYHRMSVHNFDGIIGLMGRATVPSAREKGGYNIVEIRSDSVFFSSKTTGEGEAALFAKFSLLNNDLIKDLPTATRPDYSSNTEYASLLHFPVQRSDSAAVYTGVAVKGSLYYYADSRGLVHAVNAQTGKEVWTQKIAGPVYSTPLIVDGKLVVGSIDGVLRAFSLNSGEELWRLDLGGSPVTADGAVEGHDVFIGAGSVFYRINAHKGAVKWKNTSPTGRLQGKPALSKDRVVFGAWDRHLYCLNKATGAELWRWNNGKPGNLYSPANVAPVISNGAVFIVAPDRYMTAIDLRSGLQLWRNNSLTVRESMGVSADGKTIYAKIMNDSIIGVAASRVDFYLQWAVNAGFGYEHNPCPVIEHKGVIYAGGKSGLLVAIDKKSLKVLWKYTFGNSSINRITPDPRRNGVWVSLIEGKVIYVEQMY